MTTDTQPRDAVRWTEERPPPGSPLARILGCLCPVIDNHYGKGCGGNGKRWGWFVNERCKLHRPPTRGEQDD